MEIINQIAKRGGNAGRWGGVARTEPEGERECWEQSPEFNMSPQWHQKGKKKKKEMKENCKFFFVTILKRTKFCWEIGHKRCEEARKEGRTFVCKCSIEVGLFRQKHCDQRGDFQSSNGQSAAFQSPIVSKIKGWPEHCSITAYRKKSGFETSIFIIKWRINSCISCSD